MMKASLLNDSAKIIKTVNSKKYGEFVTQAIQLYTVSGRTSQAASLAKDAAEKAEEDYDYELAIPLFEQAANLYDMDN